MGRAMKTLEMTVWRAIQLIDAFDKMIEESYTPGWPRPKVDWRDVPMSTYRKILGHTNEKAYVLDTIWERYGNLTLHRSVIELAENLDWDSLSKKRRKEIGDGLDRLNQRLADESA